MKKITCVVLYGAKYLVEQTKETKRSKRGMGYADLGLFTLEKDAYMAIKVYEKVLEASKLEDITPCEGYDIDKIILPEKDVTNIKYYNNIQEFVNDNEVIARCAKKIGKKNIDKILVDLGLALNSEQKRIIERMISDYVLKARLEKDLPKAVENCEEDIAFLRALLDGTIEL